MEQETEDFLRQEAQHARKHRRHVAALIKKYSGVADLPAQIDRGYTNLLDNETLEFDLAYIADIEATFTPLFGMMLNNVKSLFRGGADPVPSLFLWHFTEEIEHRSSALGIYNTSVASPWYRVKVLLKVMRRVTQMLNIAMEALAAHVPRQDRGPATGSLTGFRSPAFRDIPRRELVSTIYRLALSQMPFHRPEHQPVPRFTMEWLDAETAGKDITHNLNRTRVCA